jgi:hypothetical protein
MFQTIPSSPVLAFVIPGFICCIEPTLPTSADRSVFNHVCKALETIPNGKNCSFCPQRKRRWG